MSLPVLRMSWTMVYLILFVFTPSMTTALSIVRHRGWNQPRVQLQQEPSLLSLGMASDGGMKKKRRRKQPLVMTETVGPIVPTDDDSTEDEEEEEDSSQGEQQDKELILAELKAVASFRPTTREEKIMGTKVTYPSQPVNMDIASVESSLVDLPDIKNVLQKKEMKKMEEEQEKKSVRPKISRKDKEAFIRLLEEQPFADADDSYFEEEEYDVINALLAERAQPFLGIPLGPLQVGHFLGALVITLMAFVQYPGFPLTNLPTPMREALQQGLLAIYSINAVLAVLASFKAAERGQPKFLWLLKTFSVGGLSYDQLTQLPTLEEMKIEDERKKRATQSKARKR